MKPRGKQMQLLDFFFDWIEENECSPSFADVENATGYGMSAVSDALRYLRMKGLVEVDKQTYSGGGRIYAVTRVHHPERGSTEPIENARYDEILGASYFADDLATMSPIIERNCLNCKAKFATRGRFNRLCAMCASDGDSPQQVAPGGYVCNALAISYGNPSAGIGGFKRGTK